MVNFVFTAPSVEKLLSVKFSEAEVAEMRNVKEQLFLLGILWNISFGTPFFKGNFHSGNPKFGPGKICNLQ